MLFWVLGLGLAFTFFSKRGFLGIDAPPDVVRRTSWVLLAVTFAATAMSLAFVGRRVLSSFVPFIAVFAVHGILKARRHAPQAPKA